MNGKKRRRVLDFALTLVVLLGYAFWVVAGVAVIVFGCWYAVTHGW